MSEAKPTKEVAELTNQRLTHFLDMQRALVKRVMDLEFERTQFKRVVYLFSGMFWVLFMLMMRRPGKPLPYTATALTGALFLILGSVDFAADWLFFGSQRKGLVNDLPPCPPEIGEIPDAATITKPDVLLAQLRRKHLTYDILFCVAGILFLIGAFLMRPQPAGG